jgi:hypothetical protein
MGFDGLFFGRIDIQDHAQRSATKTMEMVWKGSNNLGESSWLFTGVIPRTYTPPGSFCFDYFCGDEPIKVSSLSLFYSRICGIYRMILNYMITMYKNESKHLLMFHMIKFEFYSSRYLIAIICMHFRQEFLLQII